MDEIRPKPDIQRCLFKHLSLAHFVRSDFAMCSPREILPGRFYMITRRCTQRQFLLRPDKETNNAFIYCLAEAAQRFGIEVILSCAMSNHHHTVVFDRHGTLPAFVEHFHKLFAKCQNALRGRWENLWSAEQASYVPLNTPADVLLALAYAASNPVKDRLVERVHHWPGVNGLSSLLHGRPLHATRPRHFFRTNGPMPATATLQLAIPPELGDAEEFLTALERLVDEREKEILAERRETGARVLGRQAVMRQSWRGCPATHEPRREMSPRVSNHSRWSHIEALRRNRSFLIAYRKARESWSRGEPVPFPRGTYWLQRFAYVPIAVY